MVGILSKLGAVCFKKTRRVMDVAVRLNLKDSHRCVRNLIRIRICKARTAPLYSNIQKFLALDTNFWLPYG